MTKGVREAVIADVAALAPRMRKTDQQEVYLASGRHPYVVLMDSFVSSKRAYTIYGGDQVIGMFGLTPHFKDPLVGIPWLLAADEFYDYVGEQAKDQSTIQFLRHCRRFIDECHRDYPLLMNYVWANNHAAIDWLRWLGFNFINEGPVGPYGETFIEFVKLGEAYV